MYRRLFQSDKNQILIEAQFFQEEKLLLSMVDFVKKYYLRHYNPLGLIDDTILEIQNIGSFPIEEFYGFYHDLAAVYRFRHGEVQLEFLFDGSTHFKKYCEEWERFFKQNVLAFCANKFFIKAVLDISVFHQHGRAASLASGRLKYFLTNYFDLKVYKYKGIMEIAS